MSENKRIIVQVKDYICPHCSKLVSHAVIRVGAEVQDLLLVDGAELECPRPECAKLIGHIQVKPLFAEKPEKRKEGWDRPGQSRKFHYYVDGRSLCRVWAFPNYDNIQADTGNKEPGEEDCARCFRKLVARRRIMGVEKIE